MYLEFLLRRAHSRRRVDRKYWSGVSLYSFTTCSNSVTVGTIGPIGSGLPQFGLPRLLAMNIPQCQDFAFNRLRFLRPAEGFQKPRLCAQKHKQKELPGPRTEKVS